MLDPMNSASAKVDREPPDAVARQRFHIASVEMFPGGAVKVTLSGGSILEGVTGCTVYKSGPRSWVTLDVAIGGEPNDVGDF